MAVLKINPYSLFRGAGVDVFAVQFLNALNNVLLSNFKAERFVHRFQSLFFCFDLSFNFRDHLRKLVLTLLAGLGIDIVSLPLAVGVSRAESALEQVVVYHRHTARPGFAYFGLVRLEWRRIVILLYPLLKPQHFGVSAAYFAVNIHRRLALV